MFCLRWWRRWRDNVWKKDCVNGFFRLPIWFARSRVISIAFVLVLNFFAPYQKWTNRTNDWYLRFTVVILFYDFVDLRFAKNDWAEFSMKKTRRFEYTSTTSTIHFWYLNFLYWDHSQVPLPLPLTCLSFVVCVCYAASFYTKHERQNTDNFTYTFFFQWSQVWKILWNWQKFRIFSVWKSREKNSTPSTDFKCKRLEEIKWGKNNLQIGVANTNMFVVLFSLLSIHTSRMWISNCDLLGYVSGFFSWRWNYVKSFIGRLHASVRFYWLTLYKCLCAVDSAIAVTFRQVLSPMRIDTHRTANGAVASGLFGNHLFVFFFSGCQINPTQYWITTFWIAIVRKNCYEWNEIWEPPADPLQSHLLCRIHLILGMNFQMQIENEQFFLHCK